jgi:hypothetical protein
MMDSSWNFFSAFAVDDSKQRDELEGVLIAALPTANNGAKPRLKKARLPSPPPPSSSGATAETKRDG